MRTTMLENPNVGWGAEHGICPKCNRCVTKTRFATFTMIFHESPRCEPYRNLKQPIQEGWDLRSWRLLSSVKDCAKPTLSCAPVVEPYLGDI
jgi:hypothetical protein